MNMRYDKHTAGFFGWMIPRVGVKCKDFKNALYSPLDTTVATVPMLQWDRPETR